MLDNGVMCRSWDYVVMTWGLFEARSNKLAQPWF